MALPPGATGSAVTGEQISTETTACKARFCIKKREIFLIFSLRLPAVDWTGGVSPSAGECRRGTGTAQLFSQKRILARHFGPAACGG